MILKEISSAYQLSGANQSPPKSPHNNHCPQITNHLHLFPLSTPFPASTKAQKLMMLSCHWSLPSKLHHYFNILIPGDLRLIVVISLCFIWSL